MNPPIAEAESLRTMDKEHVWHPLMNHSGIEENPLDVVVKAKGSTIQGRLRQGIHRRHGGALVREHRLRAR